MIAQWVRRFLVVSSVGLGAMVVAPLSSNASGVPATQTAQPQAPVVVRPVASALPAVFSVQAFVGVPANYVYNPALGSLHDYCTSSPDSWFAADFRGPCAVHDLCYEVPGSHKKFCDDQLEVQLTENCDAAYAPGINRSTCHGTANVYWAAVTAFGDD
jgi:hypothetical protein